MTILIAIGSIGVLIVLHELGHFFLAKKFGVKVEEFGIGMPPRMFGKKWGETLFSINLLPVGGFVRMEGEEKRSGGPRSFSQKSVWQRLLIVAGGVLVFWIIAAAILGLLGATSGIPMAVSDEETQGIGVPRIQVVGVAQGSPAEHAGIRLGDTIAAYQVAASPGPTEITKVSELQNLSEQYKGEELLLTIQRGSETMPISLAPRIDPPAGEGAMGMTLARTALVKYPWYEAPVQGALLTGRLTFNIVRGLGDLLASLAGGRGLPAGVQLTGPIGIVGLLTNSFDLGAPQFLFFLAVLSVYLAIFNTIPIPALDGGRMFFLLLEGLRRKPLPEKLEQRIIIASFSVLILLMIWVTVSDITRLF